ncbi:hypothetical protein LOTGIDRAFT_230460 [Lottia gigantea]|uniref:Uncharacterized protein n=1 Tax=Lottia gigantea TaxID=225164 RepID=V4BAP5_LOTGI|nr:hypothetical protein LOTGIDRAFT_230460 [Lottia gigantea]ESP03017.1 hypothetical protein LOTGIDRAFT_230460 [Lottia gigantea]
MGLITKDYLLKSVILMISVTNIAGQFTQINSTECLGGWEEWSTFGPYEGCIPTCSGVGSRIRERNCPDSVLGAPDCLYRESERESVDCSDTPGCQPSVSGGFSAWSSWSNIGECSAYCGTGTEQVQRTRACDNPPSSGGGADCQGERIQTSDRSCSNYNFQCNFICSRFSNRILSYPRRPGQYLQCTYGNVLWRDCQPASVYRSDLQSINSQFSWFNFNYNMWIQRNNLGTLLSVCS